MYNNRYTINNLELTGIINNQSKKFMSEFKAKKKKKLSSLNSLLH